MSEQVTIEQIITVLEALAIKPNNLVSLSTMKFIDKIKAHGIAPPYGLVLVPVEDCGLCGNNGCISCWKNPRSKYFLKVDKTKHWSEHPNGGHK